MKVGIIGYGLIGKKRLNNLMTNDQVLGICDTNHKSLEKFKKHKTIKVTTNYKDIINDSEIEVVIVSVVNNEACKIVCDALRKKKRVLCEKPLGINALESKKIFKLSKKMRLPVKVGFNHRFHPAMLKAKSLLDRGRIGKILSMRSYYGHGGRPGMETEWRCSKEKCGGGELIDQGVHIIDLFNWFGNSKVLNIYGNIFYSFWKTDVEDNAIINLEMKRNIFCNAHVSWTNWKNEFYFYINGSDGYIKINGLGNSYGCETLELGKRNKRGGKPKIKKFKYTNKDDSWSREWIEFKNSIRQNRQPIGNASDGLKANEIVNHLYKICKKQK